MIYLLDVSLLVALLDENHIHNGVARSWFHGLKNDGWATCPITENGFLRIVGSPTYPFPLGAPEYVFDLLAEFCRHDGHQFWPNDLSLLETQAEFFPRSVASRDITDLYLLALALRHGGQFATLDRRIPAHLLANGTASLHVVG